MFTDSPYSTQDSGCCVYHSSFRDGPVGQVLKSSQEALFGKCPLCQLCQGPHGVDDLDVFHLLLLLSIDFGGETCDLRISWDDKMMWELH